MNSRLLHALDKNDLRDNRTKHSNPTKIRAWRRLKKRERNALTLDLEERLLDMREEDEERRKEWAEEYEKMMEDWEPVYLDPMWRDFTFPDREEYSEEELNDHLGFGYDAYPPYGNLRTEDQIIADMDRKRQEILDDYINRKSKPWEKALIATQHREVRARNVCTCECGEFIFMEDAYKCLYCGVFLCRACGEIHFGKTVQQWIEEKRAECRLEAEEQLSNNVNEQPNLSNT